MHYLYVIQLSGTDRTFLCLISLGSVWSLSTQSQRLWANLPQERVQQLYDWVLHQTVVCIQARGAATPYWHLTSRVPMLPTLISICSALVIVAVQSCDLSPCSSFISHLSVWVLDLFSAGQCVSRLSKPSGSQGVCSLSPRHFTTPQIPVSPVDGWTSLQNRSQQTDDWMLLKLFQVVWNCFLRDFFVSSYVLLPLHHILNTAALFIPLCLTTRPVISIFFLFLMHTAVWL